LNGVIRELALEAGATGHFPLWETAPAKKEGAEYHLNVRLVSPRARDLLPAGHEYAKAQFSLAGVGTTGESKIMTGGSLTLNQTDTRLEVSGNGFSFGLDKQSGLMSSLAQGGRELLLTPLTPNFWRAPTDNDFGNYMQDWAVAWREAGENRSLDAFEVVSQDQGRVVIRANYSFTDGQGRSLARWESVFTVEARGTIHVVNQFEKEDGLPVLPRLGMNMELIRDLDQVSWFGRGPFENYSDRKLAADVGLYRNRVEDHYVPYMRPQENGYKTDVRWLRLEDGGSKGVLIKADDLLGFSVHHNRLEDFVPPVKIAITSEDGPGARDNDQRVNVHVNDVIPRDLVSLNIDLGQMGVGGDDSWGKRTLQKYSLNRKEYTYGFTISLVDSDAE
jgi:beta-galactosidase